jgi:hypothetical protein
MTRKTTVGGTTLGTLALLAAFSMNVGTARAASCLGGKLKAIAKKEAGLLKCQARDALKPNPTNLSACESKFMGRFGPACSKAGVCAGDCATCESNADSCETNVRAAFGPNAALLRSASKLVKGEIRCYMKATAKSAAADTGICLPRAQGKFTGNATQRTTAEQDCVDDQVLTDGGGSPPAGMVTDLCSSSTTTSTTTTSTTTTTLLCCNVLVVGNQAACYESTDCTGATQGGTGTLCDNGTCGATRVVADSCCTHPGGCFEYSSANAFGDSACDGASGTTTTGTTCDPGTGLCM